MRHKTTASKYKNVPSLISTQSASISVAMNELLRVEIQRVPRTQFQFIFEARNTSSSRAPQEPMAAADE